MTDAAVLNFRHRALIKGLTWPTGLWSEEEVKRVLDQDPVLLNRGLLHTVCSTWPEARGVPMARFLLRAKADPNMVNHHYGSSPFLHAVHAAGVKGDYALARLLIDYGARITAPSQGILPAELASYVACRQTALGTRRQMLIQLYLWMRRAFRLPRELIQLLLTSEQPEGWHCYHSCHKCSEEGIETALMFKKLRGDYKPRFSLLYEGFL